jgi:uncharacterized protein (DUF111 family)
MIRPVLCALLILIFSPASAAICCSARLCKLAFRSICCAIPWRLRIKVGFWQGREVNAAPEFEDCRRAAEAHAVPVKRVLEIALQAYRSRQ